MPMWAQAMLWGTLAGGALVLGSWLSWMWTIPAKLVSSVMAFGAGVWPTVAGFLAGAVVYVSANAWLARSGAKDRKRSKEQQPSEKENPGSGKAIAIGASLMASPSQWSLALA